MWPCGPDVFAESLLNTDTRIKRRHVPLVFVLTGFCICNLFTLFLMLCFQKHDTPWLAIFSSPAVWGIIVAHFSNNWGFYTFLTCLPSYFKEVLNFSISKVRKTCWYQDRSELHSTLFIDLSFIRGTQRQFSEEYLFGRRF